MPNANAPSFTEKLAALRRERSNVALPYLAAVYLMLISCFVLIPSIGGWSGLALIPIMGLLQYYIVISGHEAVHSTLCQPKRLNEFLGVFGQALVGVNFTAYRQQHLDHHTCQNNAQDPDGHIYFSIISAKAGTRRWTKLIFGTIIEIFIKIRQKGSGGYGSERKLRPRIQHGMRRDSILVILAQLSLMLLCYWSFSKAVQWPFESIFGQLVQIVVAYALLWITPLFGIAVFLNRCRILTEHGLALQLARSLDKEFGGPRIPTIDVVPNAFERRLFAPFLFNYHCAHHLYMTVPHYNLPKLHALLIEFEVSGHHRVSGGYLSAIKRCMSIS